MQDIELQEAADRWSMGQKEKALAAPASPPKVAGEQLVAWGWSKSKATFRNHLQLEYRMQEGEWRKLWTEQHGTCPVCERELAHAFDNNPTKLALKPHVGAAKEGMYRLYCASCHGMLKGVRDRLSFYQRLLKEFE